MQAKTKKQAGIDQQKKISRPNLENKLIQSINNNISNQNRETSKELEP